LNDVDAKALAHTLHESGVLWRIDDTLILDARHIAEQVQSVHFNLGKRKEDNDAKQSQHALLT
jgi:hypothetical protein